MKFSIVFAIYLLVGGALSAKIVNGNIERCGDTGFILNTYKASLYWPMVATSYPFFSEVTVAHIKNHKNQCKESPTQ